MPCEKLCSLGSTPSCSSCSSNAYVLFEGGAAMPSCSVTAKARGSGKGKVVQLDGSTWASPRETARSSARSSAGEGRLARAARRPLRRALRRRRRGKVDELDGEGCLAR